MSVEDLAIILLLSLAPLSECRGAIVYGALKGLDPSLTLLLSIAGNVAPAFVLPRLLSKLEEFVLRTELSTIYVRYIGYARRRVEPYVERYGFLGLTIFVSIPLPITGVYTGSLAAHVLGVKRQELALSLGVVLAAMLTFISTYLLRTVLVSA